MNKKASQIRGIFCQGCITKFLELLWWTQKTVLFVAMWLISHLFYSYTCHINIPWLIPGRSATSVLPVLISLKWSQLFPRPRGFSRYESLRYQCKTSFHGVNEDCNLAVFLWKWKRFFVLFARLHNVWYSLVSPCLHEIFVITAFQFLYTALVLEKAWLKSILQAMKPLFETDLMVICFPTH